MYLIWRFHGHYQLRFNLSRNSSVWVGLTYRNVIDSGLAMVTKTITGKTKNIYVSTNVTFLKIYQGNNDQNTVVVNTLIEPIEARYIRLHPTAWYGHISLRMELYGCSVDSGNVRNVLEYMPSVSFLKVLEA